MDVIVIGHPKSKATRAAKRFFSERRIPIHDRDLRKRELGAGELRRWVQHLGVDAVVDTSATPYVEGGLRYLSLDSEGWIERCVQEPALLRLPLVRCGNVLAVGDDPAGWERVADQARAS